MGLGNILDINCGIGTDDNDFIVPEVVETPKISSTNIKDLLSVMGSGIGLDISKEHTGVFLYRDGKLEEYGFKINYEYDAKDYSAEAKMRIAFREQLYNILKGYHWENCVVEDCINGVNFDTNRKLLALNCVVDELVLDGRLQIDNIYRFEQSKWLSYLRKIKKLGNKLNTKYECQELLKLIGYEYAIDNSTKTKQEKKDMFYEDICDAAGQLVGLATFLNFKDTFGKSSSLKTSNIKMYFTEEFYDIYDTNDLVIDVCLIKEVELPTRKLEDSIKELVKDNTDSVMYARVECKDLGNFGVSKGFKFYKQGYGYLFFYNKDIKKNLR